MQLLQSQGEASQLKQGLSGVTAVVALADVPGPNMEAAGMQVIDKIRHNPEDRRIVLTAWNPAALPEMALPPCHMFCQACTNDLCTTIATLALADLLCKNYCMLHEDISQVVHCQDVPYMSFMCCKIFSLDNPALQWQSPTAALKSAGSCAAVLHSRRRAVVSDVPAQL